MADNRYKDLFLHLQDEGFNVFTPGTKTGDCLVSYLVPKKEGSSVHPGISTDVDLYSIICYVPQKKYSELESLVQQVKESMKSIEPLFMPTGEQTPSFYDESVKGHYISIVYRNNKKRF